MLDIILFYLAAPFRRFVTPDDQFNAWMLAGSLAFAMAWFALRRPKRAFARARAVLAAAFPARVWLHRSSLLDVKLFFLSSFLIASGALGQLVTGGKIAGALDDGLVRAFGPSPFASEASVPVALAMTVGYVLVVDLAYWYAHWIMHRMPAMWEFHKLHHSAEVMTPLTEWRQHPVELLLFPAVIALFMGAFYGAMTYLFGAAAQPFTWFNLNALMLAFMATTLHLRHSHFWLPATGWLGYVIQSPAHHQIHHSDQDRHYGKNLGLVLSVWDWAFGTLYIPNEKETLAFGIGEEGHSHDGALSAYWIPIVKAWKHVAPETPDAVQAPARTQAP